MFFSCSFSRFLLFIHPLLVFLFVLTYLLALETFVSVEDSLEALKCLYKHPLLDILVITCFLNFLSVTRMLIFKQTVEGCMQLLLVHVEEHKNRKYSRISSDRVDAFSAPNFRRFSPPIIVNVS